jgi:hypothetical protein
MVGFTVVQDFHIVRGLGKIAKYLVAVENVSVLICVSSVVKENSVFH